jgi:hypothetical protein
VPAKGRRPYLQSRRERWANRKRGPKKKSNQIRLSESLPEVQQRIEEKQPIRKKFANAGKQQKKQRKVEVENAEILKNNTELMDASTPNAAQQQVVPKKQSLYRQMMKLQENSKKSSESRRTRGIYRDIHSIRNPKYR